MENILNSVGMVWFLVFFRSAPPTPPSFVAMRNHSSITQGMWQDFKVLLNNRNYKLILGAFAFIFFSYNAIGVNLSLLFKPFGASSGKDSVLGIIFVTVGTIACFASGFALDRTNKFLFALRFVCAGTLINLIAAIFLCMTKQFWALCLFAALAGFTIVPIVPVAFTFAGEVTYPLAPAMVIGLMTTVSNLTLFCIQFLYAYILSSGTATASYIVFGTMAFEALVALICTIFVKEDLRRLSSVSDINLMMRKASNASRSGSIIVGSSEGS